MGVTIYQFLDGIDPSVYTGVDAATLTTTSPLGHMAMSAAISSLTPYIESYKSKPFKANGATGWVKGAVKFAQRVDLRQGRVWAILAVVGPLAHNVVKYGKCDCKSTRLDLRVDVRLMRPVPDFTTRLYELIGGGRSNAKLIVSRSGGTLYPHNDRTATYYARIYDKSDTYDESAGTVWRYEVEIKREAANLVQSQLIEADDMEEYISSSVFGIIKDKFGLPVPREGIKPKLNYAGMTTSDNDKKLSWIKHNVAPTIRHLIAQGLTNDVLDALGVDSIVRAPDVASIESSNQIALGI
jgi:hypothetical protein